jgi:putative ABC transport system permease protein
MARTTSTAAARLGRRAFRALLTLYPGEFRDEYGREMTMVFEDRYRDASGPIDQARLWLDVLTGILIEAPREHFRSAISDLRYALRRLRASPGFAAASIMTLALAIGASTAMFSVLDAILLRALPYHHPDRLVMLWTGDPGQGARERRSAYGTIEQWRSQSRSFVDMAVFDPVSATLTTGGLSDQIAVARVSPNLFALLGVVPVRGRSFTDVEAGERRRVVVISHRFWQQRFGGAPQAVGASLELDGLPSQVVGVLPESFQLSGLDADVWEPHTLFPDWENRRTQMGAGSWFVVGRLQPGVTVEQARQEMSAMARRLDNPEPPAQTVGVGVVPLSLYVTGSRSRLVLWTLSGAALCLLLVAAANVAGLSLARSVGRLPEMSIQAALGASRARIVRQLLAESVTLAVVSGGLGLLLAVVGVRAIRAFGPGELARLQEVAVDLRVLGWAAVVSLSTGVLVGLAPAAALWRRDLRTGDAGGRRGSAGAATTRLRRLLVGAECAAAVLLLAGAGLLLRSWWNVMQVEAGFRADRVLSISIAMPPTVPDSVRAAFYRDLVEQIAAVPGVDSAGIGSELFVGSVAPQAVTAEGGDRGSPQGLRVQLRRDEVDAGFFNALGTPLLRGRFFSSVDGPGAPRVGIVNEALASRLWPGRDPLGRRFAVGPIAEDTVWFTVVGVVGNMRRQGLETEPIPQVFESLAQNPPRRAILFVAASVADPRQLAGPIRSLVAGLDPRVVVYGVTTVAERLGGMMSQRRLQMWLLTGCAALALLLATVGIYGLIQYSVAARTHEIGIRRALGAQAGDIFRMVIGEGVILSLAGLGLGLAGAWWLGEAASSLLFGVSATDPVTFAAVSLLVMAVTFAGCCLPARRAMRVAPIVALQQRVM